MNRTTMRGTRGSGIELGVSDGEFRSALARYPTGVAILSTTACDGRKVGLTVSSFNSVSLAPPLILWSISRKAPSLPAFQDASYFCVNVLGEQQVDLALHFARPFADKFATIRHIVHTTKVPIITDCTAYLVCRTWNQYEGGDHMIIVGEVVDLGTSGRAPLVFGLGRFGRFALDPAT